MYRSVPPEANYCLECALHCLRYHHGVQNTVQCCLPALWVCSGSLRWAKSGKTLSEQRESGGNSSVHSRGTEEASSEVRCDEEVEMPTTDVALGRAVM